MSWCQEIFGLSVIWIPKSSAIPLFIYVQMRKIFQNHGFAGIHRHALVKAQNGFQIGKHGFNAVVCIWNPESVQFFDCPQKTNVSFYAEIGAPKVLMRVVHFTIGMQSSFFKERPPLAFPFTEQPFKRCLIRMNHEVRQV